MILCVALFFKLFLMPEYIIYDWIMLKKILQKFFGFEKSIVKNKGCIHISWYIFKKLPIFEIEYNKKLDFNSKE